MYIICVYIYYIIYLYIYIYYIIYLYIYIYIISAAMERVSLEDAVGDGTRDDERNAESRSMAGLSSAGAPLGIPFLASSGVGPRNASTAFNCWVATETDCTSHLHL